jgi:hypothetical protein
MGRTRYVYRHGKRIAVETYTPPGEKHRRTRKPFKVNWFKFPAWWVEVLHKAGAGARLLAPIILAEAFKREYIKGDIVLSSEVTRMPRTTRKRAAEELVKLGLITVERNGNRALTVTAVRRVAPQKRMGSVPQTERRVPQTDGCVPKTGG